MGCLSMLATWLPLQILSVSGQPPLQEGGLTHFYAGCCLHHARAGTAGMAFKLGRLEGSSPASCSCAALCTEQRGLSYLTTYIPYSVPVIPSFSSAFSGGLLCVDAPYKETTKFTCFVSFRTSLERSQDYTESQNVLSWKGSTRIVELPS